MATPTQTKPPTKREVADATTIEPAALTEEFVRAPGDIAHWAGLYTEALEGQLLAEANRKRVKEEALLRIKKSAADKPTEKVLTALVETDPDYQVAVLEEIRADVKKSKVTGILEAVRAKKDILISLGAHLRHADELRIYKSGRKQ